MRCTTFVWAALWGATILLPNVKATLVDALAPIPEFETLVALATAADLIDTLSSPGPFTLFAPTNNAFATLRNFSPLFFDALQTAGWQLHLNETLKFHIAPGEFRAAAIQAGATLTMLNSEEIDIRDDVAPAVAILPAVGTDAAFGILVDLPASNGVIHLVEDVLAPSFLSLTLVDVLTMVAPLLSELVAMVDLEGTLADEFGLTIFAPSNDAFLRLGAKTLAYLTSSRGAKDLASIILNHVVTDVIPSTLIQSSTTFVTSLQGSTLEINFDDELSTVSVNRALVTNTDVLALNGIVHEIDSVLIPFPIPGLQPKGKGRTPPFQKGKGRIKAQNRSYNKSSGKPKKAKDITMIKKSSSKPKAKGKGKGNVVQPYSYGGTRYWKTSKDTPVKGM